MGGYSAEETGKPVKKDSDKIINDLKNFMRKTGQVMAVDDNGMVIFVPLNEIKHPVLNLG